MAGKFYIELAVFVDRDLHRYKVVFSLDFNIIKCLAQAASIVIVSLQKDANEACLS